MNITDEMVAAAARAVCRSGEFETGEGGCAPVCLENFGVARYKCRHAFNVHGKISRTVIEAVAPMMEAAVLEQVADFLETAPHHPDYDSEARGDGYHGGLITGQDHVVDLFRTKAKGARGWIK